MEGGVAVLDDDAGALGARHRLGAGDRRALRREDLRRSREHEDVARGWVRGRPPEQRDSLLEAIDDLGLDPELFADELQSEEGWGEDEEARAGESRPANAACAVSETCAPPSHSHMSRTVER